MSSSQNNSPDVPNGLPEELLRHSLLLYEQEEFNSHADNCQVVPLPDPPPLLAAVEETPELQLEQPATLTYYQLVKRDTAAYLRARQIVVDRVRKERLKQNRPNVLVPRVTFPVRSTAAPQPRTSTCSHLSELPSCRWTVASWSEGSAGKNRVRPVRTLGSVVPPQREKRTTKQQVLVERERRSATDTGFQLDPQSLQRRPKPAAALAGEQEIPGKRFPLSEMNRKIGRPTAVHPRRWSVEIPPDDGHAELQSGQPLLQARSPYPMKMQLEESRRTHCLELERGKGRTRNCTSLEL